MRKDHRNSTSTLQAMPAIIAGSLVIAMLTGCLSAGESSVDTHFPAGTEVAEIEARLGTEYDKMGAGIDYDGEPTLRQRENDAIFAMVYENHEVIYEFNSYGRLLRYSSNVRETPDSE